MIDVAAINTSQPAGATRANSSPFARRRPACLACEPDAELIAPPPFDFRIANEIVAERHETEFVWHRHLVAADDFGAAAGDVADCAVDDRHVAGKHDLALLENALASRNPVFRGRNILRHAAIIDAGESFKTLNNQ